MRLYHYLSRKIDTNGLAGQISYYSATLSVIGRHSDLYLICSMLIAPQLCNTDDFISATLISVAGSAHE